MDKSQPLNLVNLQEPLEMPVSELLTGNYHFVIPSYQRGYRWESSTDSGDQKVRQVDDLLNDLTDFVDKNATLKANYYLQPLMVKPRYDDNGRLVWDVLDGQQRLTTMLLLLICLNEKQNQGYPLYTIEYANRPDIDFSRITYNPNSDYPLPNANLDSFFVRKAKDRIEDWYKKEVSTTRQRRDNLNNALFYEDNSRLPSSTPNLRALFIWYNVSPLNPSNPSTSTSVNLVDDIAIFNRLNGGKISLTNSELLKALFLLCVKVDKKQSGTCIIDEETLVRRWDEMERKFQDNEFWNAISPKTRTYENRLDFLFDFIRESDPNSSTDNSYRYFYKDMKCLLTKHNSKKLEEEWEVVTRHFDILCKWHENTTLHNYIGFLIDCGKSPADILKEIKKNTGKNANSTVIDLVKDQIKTDDDVFTLRYDRNEKLIRRILLLFNVEVSEKHKERFSFHQYRERKYDIEHVNSQTENAIVKPQERLDWVKEQALSALGDDMSTMTPSSEDYNKLNQYIQEGTTLCDQGEGMKQIDFDSYRQKVENYYAPEYKRFDKHWIGNLTLLNSSINREYKNALFPIKLRTIKGRDQEGEYIPPCTRYLFLKYYSDIQGNPSSFNNKRWNEEDQIDYANAIYNTLKKFLS